MYEEFRHYLFRLLADIAATDTQVILLAILLVAMVIVLDAVSGFARETRKKSGFEDDAAAPNAKNRNSLPARRYISDMQLLSGTPDGLISENGCIIPVERKPLAKKIRDRYIAQLLVYMRLVEEFEGKKPPYGYLVLGSNCRKVKIYNTDERQAWLQKLIDEMQEVLQGRAAAVPAPEFHKCKKCTVRLRCPQRADIHGRESGLQRAIGSVNCVSESPRKDSISEMMPSSSADHVQGSGLIAVTLSSSKSHE